MYKNFVKVLKKCPFLIVFLLDERAGNLTFVLNSVDKIKAVKSQVTMIVRGMYSNPPNHGARIVSTILNNEELKKEW